MPKLFFLLCISLFSSFSYSQALDGLYIGTELRPHRIDSLGHLQFTGNNYKNYWFFDVRVSIKGEHISIRKLYAYSDSLGKKHYADTNTHEFWYVGKLVKAENRYIASMRLVNQPTLHPNKEGQPNMREARQEEHE